MWFNWAKPQWDSQGQKLILPYVQKREKDDGDKDRFDICKFIDRIYLKMVEGKN